jgi:hypothetical protein
VGVQLDDWRLVTGFSGGLGGGGGGGRGHGRALGSSGGGPRAGSGNGGGSGGGGAAAAAAAWWHSSGAWGDEGCGWPGAAGAASTGHSLEVYDIRAAASCGSAAAGPSGGAAAAGAGGGGGGGSASAAAGGQGLWTAAPVMSLPVPDRVTCFQVRAGMRRGCAPARCTCAAHRRDACRALLLLTGTRPARPSSRPPVRCPARAQFHGQRLLVGQEGADCCLLSFHPPGSRSARAAAAWGYGQAGGVGGAPGSSAGAAGGYAAAGVACYGASPGGGFVGGASPGMLGGTGAGGGGGGAAATAAAQAGDGEPGGGRGGKKKGAAKVPAKKQTRYPKRATR